MGFWEKGRKKKKKNNQEILLQHKKDRRILDNVPDTEMIRKNRDRRGKSLLSKDENVSVNDFIRQKNGGIRYTVDYDVMISGKTKDGSKFHFTCKGIDISTTGILLKTTSVQQKEQLENTEKLHLKFEITPGSMPEGYEMKIRTTGLIRRISETEDNCLLLGVEFVKTLSQYANRKKGRYDLLIASLFLFSISFFIILMRAESVIYFKFNKWLYLYSIIAAAFLLSRYLFSLFYRAVPIDPDFTPGVSIIIPCFNEEEWIERTILSCINQDYPVDKLEVIIVDDCSNDKSVEKVKEVMERLYQEADQFKTKERLKCIVQHKNAGKRDALVLGAEAAHHELIVFVDSDSFLDPFAIRNLVQPFKDPKMGGCAGRTDVANTYTNNLTKMQAVRYYIAFRVMKAAEGYFDTVSCLSGPLSCYRKDIVLENKRAWLDQKFLGQKATFGDDRSMTNFVLRKHRTTYQDTAICSTIVPSSHKVFLKQQMRWKRSWLRESLIAGGFMWKKEPLAAISFYMGLFVPIAAPIVVLYNLVYVPVMKHIFPSTFLIGILMMSMLMSMAQLLLRKSSTWIYGLFFCLYYEVVLLWQMPVAWVTFWKSTWGTRMTPSDLLAMQRRTGKGIAIAAGKEGAAEIKAVVDPIPVTGFTVTTAFANCYMKDDTNLTPETGMTPAADTMNESETAAVETFAEKTEATAAEAKVPAEKTEIPVAEVKVPVEKTEASVENTKLFAAKVETSSDKMEIPVLKNTEISDMKETLSRQISQQFTQSSYTDMVGTEFGSDISALAKEIAEEIRESIRTELKVELREKMKASVMEEVRQELKAELKKQVMKELLENGRHNE